MMFFHTVSLGAQPVVFSGSSTARMRYHWYPLPILSLKKAKAIATAVPAAANAAKIYFQLNPAANIMQQPMMP